MKVLVFIFAITGTSLFGTIGGFLVAILLTIELPYLHARKTRYCKYCMWYLREDKKCLRCGRWTRNTDTCNKFKNQKITIFFGKGEK